MTKRNLSKKTKRKLSRKLKRKTLNRKRGGVMDPRPIDNVTAVIIYLVVVYATIYIGVSLVQPYINGGGAKTFTEILNDLKSCINDDNKAYFERFAKRVTINNKNTLMIKNVTDDEMNVLQKYIESKYIKSNSIKSKYIKSKNIKSNSIKSNSIEILLHEIDVNKCINKIKELDIDNIIVTIDCINKIEKMTTPLRG
jgi:hypothetical protein